MLVSIARGFAGGSVLCVMATAIQTLYGMGNSINDFLDDHISQMKLSDNNTVSQTGCVIEGAKFGFGLGYVSSVVIIATGQYLLGNTLAAVATAGTALTFSNPIAMTCAAVGAIYYGWNALGEKERQGILENLTKGLDIGAELIKSIVQFLITTTKELLSSKSIDDFKNYIKEYASNFGKTLYDITGKMADYVAGAAEQVGKLSIQAGELTVNAVGATTTVIKLAMNKTGEAATSAAGATSSALKSAYGLSGEAASSAADSTTSALKDAYLWTGDAANNLTNSTKQAFAAKKVKTALVDTIGKVSIEGLPSKR